MVDAEHRAAGGLEPDDSARTGRRKGTVPTECFDTRTMAPEDRLPAFRRLTSTLFDVWALDDPAAFDVQATGHRVGSMIFNRVHYNSPARFRRSEVHCRGRGNDFFVMESMLSGEQRLVMPGRHMRAVAGNVYLRDWGQEFDAHATAMRLDSVVIPRHLVEAGAMVDRTSPVFSWSHAEPAGRHLSTLFAALLDELPHVGPADAENLTVAFLGFLNGLLGRRPTCQSPAELGAMQHFLDARLHANVGVEDLCRQFNVSRSQVYRVFQPVGGVRSYLTQARLERCFTELLVADPARVRVADIASSWGFPEASSFCRRFRATFHTTPSRVLGRAQARQSDRTLSLTAEDDGYCRRYVEWFEQLAPCRDTDQPDQPRSEATPVKDRRPVDPVTAAS